MELPEDSITCFQCGATQDKNFNFYNWIAFISYSHGDWDVARYIEKELKKFKLPFTIGLENPELKNIKFDQIFRDENNFGNGTLADQIEFGLHNSKYLISICSPFYAAKKEGTVTWCNEEIKRFFNYHNKNRTLLIPLIVDGMPHSKNECFPDSLLDITDGTEEAKDILGIDCTKIRCLLDRDEKGITEKGMNGEEKQNLSAEERDIKDEIFDAIKARLLGLNYGAYRNYVHQKRYFKDYVDRNGIPEGICELTNEEWLKTPHYKFIYREDLLDEVVYENGSGTVINHKNQEDFEKLVDVVFRYDEKGDLIRTENKDRYGNIICYEEYKKNYGVINYFDALENSKMYDGSFFDPEEKTFNSGVKKADIRSVKIQRDQNGFITRKTFHKYHNENYPVSNNDGFYGLEYENYPNGQIKNFWYLDENGNRCLSKYGYSGKNYEYNSDGIRIKVTYLDQNNNPVKNEKGYKSYLITVDEAWNCIEEIYFYENKNAIAGANGNFKIIWKYDNRGNKIEETYVRKVKRTYAKKLFKYDSRGNILEMSYTDENEKLVKAAVGYASCKYKYDENCNWIEKTFFDENGNPILYKDTFHKLQKKYNELGYIIETSYFGMNDEPVICKDGFAKTVTIRDENGNGLELSYFGTDGKPALYHNFAKLCSKYDDRGNCIESVFYGLNGEPVLNFTSRHMWKAKYDDRGNQIEETSYGIKGEPVLHKDGYFMLKKFFDEKNKCILEIQYDTELKEIKRIP